MEPVAANQQSKFFTAIRIFFTGLAMGIADLIPGVSGGTMAFILGVYEQLLNAIKSFNLRLLKTIFQGKFHEALQAVPLAFLIPLVLGLAVAIFSMARVMAYLLTNETVYLFSFFVGLIIASCLTIGITVKWRTATSLALVIGAIGAFFIVGLVPISMPNDPVTLFFCSILAITAMILPGISGSFVLLIMGQYAYVLTAVVNFDLLTLLPVILGAIVGLIGFARVLGYLLKHYHAVTVALLIGFMVGSLRKIWPWKEVIETGLDRHGEIIPLRELNILPNFGTAEIWIALAFALLGFLLLNVLDQLQTGNNVVVRRLWRRG